jgi:glycogen(starch) synthase
MSQTAEAEDIFDCVVMPDTAPEDLRKRFGLSAHEAPRLAFIAGPGDAAGSFEYWEAGNYDPRVPVIAYSTQYYSVAAKAGAHSLVLHETLDEPAISDPRFRFVSIPRRRFGGFVKYTLGNFVFGVKVLAELRRFRPHAVVCGTDMPLVLLLLLPRKTQVILAAHNTYWPAGRRPTHWRARAKQWLVTVGLRRVNAAVCTSQECADQMEQLRPLTFAKFVEIPQILSVHVSGSTVRAPDAPVHRLLYLGRMEVEKGIYDILDAFEALAHKHTDVTLDFAGPGGQAEAFTQRVAASSAKVRYLGNLAAADVHTALTAADLLICPTQSNFNEGLSLVVVEAAVHGVPSLVSSIVPAKNLFVGACAVFPVDDVDALRTMLDKLLSDDESHSALCRELPSRISLFFDRKKSWGSKFYEALMS